MVNQPQAKANANAKAKRNPRVPNCSGTDQITFSELIPRAIKPGGEDAY
jgi:hypothetical protein